VRGARKKKRPADFAAARKKGDLLNRGTWEKRKRGCIPLTTTYVNSLLLHQKEGKKKEEKKGARDRLFSSYPAQRRKGGGLEPFPMPSSKKKEKEGSSCVLKGGEDKGPYFLGAKKRGIDRDPVPS